MALPPKGDPRRPLHLAIRSTRMMGFLFILFSVIGLLPLLLLRRGVGVWVGSYRSILILFFYAGPAVGYFLISIYLKQRRYWAVVAGIILASIHLLMSVAGAAVFAVVISNQSLWSEPIILVPIFFIAAIVLALAQLVYHLALSFTAIKYVDVEEVHGFEPVMGLPNSTTQDPDLTNK